MFKRITTAVISAVLLLSVSCSALNITNVAVKMASNPQSELDRRFTITTDEYVGYSSLVIAFYSEKGRFLGMEFIPVDKKKNESDEDVEIHPDDSEFPIIRAAKQLPCNVKFFFLSGNDDSTLASARPISNVYEIHLMGLNEIFKRDLPDFLTDVYSDAGRATFRTPNERKIRDIIVQVGDDILTEVDSVDMTKEYLQSRFKTEIGEAKDIYYSMTTTEQGKFQDRFSSFTSIKNGKYVELRVYLMQIFGLI